MGLKRVGCWPEETGHRDQGTVVTDVPPSASQAPHTGGTSLSGTFHVSLAEPGDPGPGKRDEGPVALLGAASEEAGRAPCSKPGEEPSGKADVLPASEVRVGFSCRGSPGRLPRAPSGHPDSTSLCTLCLPTGRAAKGAQLSLARQSPSSAEPVLGSRGDSERGPRPQLGASGGAAIRFNGTEPFLQRVFPSSLPPTASLGRQGGCGEVGGGGPTGALTSAQPIRGRPAEDWWRRAPDGRRRHAHSQRRLATGQGLPQGCLRAGRQAGRSYHGKAAAGARWPARAGSTEVSPKGWRGMWTRGPHDAPDLATEGDGPGPEHLLCPGWEAPPDRPAVGRSKL